MSGKLGDEKENCKRKALRQLEAKEAAWRSRNGIVWLALNSESEEAAIKLLANMDGKNKAKMYSRFRSEVSVVCANCDIEGLLPVLDSFLPDDITDTLPWYVMPVAQPLYEYLDEYPAEQKIDVAITQR